MPVDDVFEIICKYLGIAGMRIINPAICSSEIIYARQLICSLLKIYFGYDEFDIAIKLNISRKKVVKYLLDFKLLFNNQDYLLSFQQRKTLNLILTECEKMIVETKDKTAKKPITNDGSEEKTYSNDKSIEL